jgi:putative spermidine/putrescine transport system ATP-binding protein
MQVEIKRLHRELGITTIYVTHDQTEAMTMSDRVVVFSNGRLAQIGTPLDVYDRPASRFVAEFIGDSNILAGTIDPAHRDIVDLAGIGKVRVATAGTLHGDVDLMVRPEKLRADFGGDAQQSKEACNRFEMTVDDVINYGDSILVIGKTRGLPLRARLAGTRPADLGPGSVLRLAFAPADAHVLARR